MSEVNGDVHRRHGSARRRDNELLRGRLRHRGRPSRHGRRTRRDDIRKRRHDNRNHRAWLALSELRPTRIRSTGMGFALVLTQAVGTGIAAVFLPTVGNFGYSAMFFFWAGCTVISFITAVFFLPETKGKTLEEIEEYFETAKLSPDLQKRGA